MTEHPLTDEICCQLWQDNKDNWLKLQEPCPATRRVMRAATDWQLKQVLEWLKTNTEDYVLEDYYSTYFLIEAFLDDFKKAMRPTTQEENND